MKTLRLFENDPQLSLAISSLVTNNSSFELSMRNLGHKIDYKNTYTLYIEYCFYGRKLQKRRQCETLILYLSKIKVGRILS
jgi:hypothetical protein